MEAKHNRPALIGDPLLGGSCIVMSGLISRVTIVINHIRKTYNRTYNYP